MASRKLETLGVTSNRLSGPLPDSWASPGAFPALKSIFCSLNMLTGTLPVSWGVNGSLPALQSIAMDGNHLEGTLPGGWGSDGGFSKLEHLDLWKNRLYGPLPQSWGRNGTFPKLQVLYLDENGLNGTLPESWGMPGAFPLLLTLYLGYNRLSGTLPAKWGADSGFAAMQNLDLTQNMLTGSLPKAWVQGENMPALIALDLSMNPLKGELPPVNNPALALLNLKSTSVTVSNESSGFWQSHSPLLLLELSNTKVAGSLPESLNFGGKLRVLHVDNTSLKGTLPFAWLGPNKTLSSLIFGGQFLWDTSASSSDWRRKVCLDEDIYQYDVVARSQVVTDSVSKQLQQSILRSPNVDAVLNNLLAWVPNSTDSIYAICHNRDAPVVIACLWGSFLALVAVIIIAYIVAGRPQGTGSRRACLSNCMQRPIALFQTLHSEILVSAGRRIFGLFGLGVYCVAHFTEIRVIIEVWPKWPAYLLLAIMLWHHVYRGLVVSFYLMRKHLRSAFLEEEGQSASLPVLEQQQFTAVWVLLAILLSPVAIISTFLMDIWSFFDVFGVPSPPLLSVESYADMRTVVMPAFQSLFSAVLTTVIFQLGNSPTNGIFYSRMIFIRSVAFSCASMLMGLCRLLVLSHGRDRQVSRTFFLLIIGGLLRPTDPTKTLRGFFAALWKWLLVHVGCLCGIEVLEEESEQVVKDPEDPEQGFFQM